MLDANARGFLKELKKDAAGVRIGLKDLILEAEPFTPDQIVSMLSDGTYGWQALLHDYAIPDLAAVADARTHGHVSIIRAVRLGDDDLASLSTDASHDLAVRVDQVLGDRTASRLGRSRFRELRSRLEELAGVAVAPTIPTDAPEEDKDRFAKLKHSVCKSAQFMSLAPVEVRVFIDALVQFNGSNNGDISLPHSRLRTIPGLASDRTLSGAIQRLLEAGFLIKTRNHSRTRCALYALSCFPIQKTLQSESKERRTWLSRSPRPRRQRRSRRKQPAAERLHS